MRFLAWILAVSLTLWFLPLTFTVTKLDPLFLPLLLTLAAWAWVIALEE